MLKPDGLLDSVSIQMLRGRGPNAGEGVPRECEAQAYFFTLRRCQVHTALAKLDRPHSDLSIGSNKRE